MTATTPQLDLPWYGRDDHRCFGCAPANPHGLALRFTDTGDGGLTTTLRVGHDHESYPGVVHGGIVALTCDEIMGNLIVLRDGRVAVTTSLRMRYVGACRVGDEYTVTAHIDRETPDVVHTVAEVTDTDGTVVAVATAAYRPLAAEPA
ncbi:MAG: hypothetical protein ABS81_00135 [Pseudonocardia sp. SCN 72-86]|nr:MAG: hypothetical protein ABS81_00135 [Pseudonocardia sp. SCN 72-86]